MDLISMAFRLNFREFCSKHLVVRQINHIFQYSGVKRTELPPDSLNGERRKLVEEYYTSLDWTRQQDVQRFLDAVHLVLAQTYMSDLQKEELLKLCRNEGLVVEQNRLSLGSSPYGSAIKNLIFAANGPKPEIILSDAIANEIQIVQNSEHCLIFAQPIHSHGLLWSELVVWWMTQTGQNQDNYNQVERQLYSRLYSSLDSHAEKLFMKAYFLEYRDKLGDQLPALIPQVYFHYDPYTFRELKGKRRLIRQRMDFLLLLPRNARVVIEIDGQQHYSSAGKPSPLLYAEMVKEDRKLKLAGYMLYRFGGNEFTIEEEVNALVSDFFDALFDRHEIGN